MKNLLTSSLRLLTSRTHVPCAFATRAPRAPAPKLNPPKAPARPAPAATPLNGAPNGEGKPCIAAKGDAKTFGAPKEKYVSKKANLNLSLKKRFSCVNFEKYQIERRFN